MDKTLDTLDELHVRVEPAEESIRADGQDSAPAPVTEFTDEQYDHAYPNGIQHHWWHLARDRIVLRDLRRHTDGSPVLDVGCGRGIAVAFLNRQGVDCEGVELGLAPAIQSDLRLHSGVAAVDLPEQLRDRFGTLLFLDVIEHLPDSAAFLRQVTAAFKNLRYVVATVPAGPELWSNYDEFYGHYRRYTGSGLDDLAEELRWDLVNRSNFFRPAYPAMFYLARSSRNRSTVVQPPRGLARGVHRVVAELMFAEHVLLPSWIPGTSLIATYRV